MNQAISSHSLKNSDDEEPKKKRTCALVSLERSAGPDGATGNDWYRYVINSPGSPITGYRRGKKSDVLEYLNECTSKLDERLNSGKAPRAPSGRKPNQAQASS
ncbi:MAG: hypothetical protein OEU36_00670 [Gammaproteobacteria bacterium]|nr:hypothetical protein [Gammaproteobacteria bacterium]